ncbi:hypothetical protein [Streptosporangium sp. NPDC000396]|uniref:hypothetical protein n=1 Tax=Streptosporangium sp. NPDC000396 TaxID=3366185 RepID=UPI0036CDB75B
MPEKALSHVTVAQRLVIADPRLAAARFLDVKVWREWHCPRGVRDPRCRRIFAGKNAQRPELEAWLIEDPWQDLLTSSPA